MIVLPMWNRGSSMKLDDVPFRVFGDVSFRGACPEEATELTTFFNMIRKEYPDTLGRLALHPRNEQMLRNGQHAAMIRHKAEGMTPGAADIIIPGGRAFVCEMKRLDHTKSRWQEGQIEYLGAAHDVGAFACVALGHQAAWEALQEWRVVS